MPYDNHKKRPDVSVITICLNAQESIEETLISVLKQSYENMEYIVVDGKSTDETMNIVKLYTDRIDKVISQSDTGIYDAMNKGWRMCTGTYVYFLNSGDRFADEHVLSDIFREKTDADVVYGDMEYDYGDGRRQLRRQPKKLGYRRFVKTSLWQPAAMVKRELLERHGGFDESLKICGDYEFFLRVLFNHDSTTKYVPRVLSLFDTRGISRDKKLYLLHYEERRQIQKKYLPWPYHGIARVRHFLIRRKRELFGQINR